MIELNQSALIESARDIARQQLIEVTGSLDANLGKFLVLFTAELDPYSTITAEHVNAVWSRIDKAGPAVVSFFFNSIAKFRFVNNLNLLAWKQLVELLAQSYGVCSEQLTNNSPALEINKRLSNVDQTAELLKANPWFVYALILSMAPCVLAPDEIKAHQSEEKDA